MDGGRFQKMRTKIIQEVEELLEFLGDSITEEKSFASPVLRKLYLTNFRKILPAQTPDGKVRGILFCNQDTGEVKSYLFCVHFPEKGEVYCVVKNYLDFLAVKSVAEKFGFVPVLTAGPIETTAKIWKMEGYKVDRPGYGKFIVLPVAGNGELWKYRVEGVLEDKLFELMEQADQLTDDLLRLRSELR